MLLLLLPAALFLEAGTRGWLQGARTRLQRQALRCCIASPAKSSPGSSRASGANPRQPEPLPQEETHCATHVSPWQAEIRGISEKRGCSYN